MHSFCLLLFVIKLYYHTNIFKVENKNNMKKKHGRDNYTWSRSIENIKTKYDITILDIKFFKQCKQEQLITIFANNVRLSTKGANTKLNHPIERIIIADELQYKHRQKKKLKNEIKSLSIQLKLLFSTVWNSLNKFEIDDHIPSRVIRISVNAEFESFYQSFLLNKSTISKENIARIKTQLRSTCEKY